MNLSKRREVFLNLVIPLIRDGGWIITGGHNAKRLPAELRQPPADDDTPKSMLNFVRDITTENDRIIVHVGDDQVRMKIDGISINAEGIDGRPAHRLFFVRLKARQRRTRLVLLHPERERRSRLKMERLRKKALRRQQEEERREREVFKARLNAHLASLKREIGDATVEDLVTDGSGLAVLFSNGMKLHVADRSACCYSPAVTINGFDVSTEDF